MRWAGRGVVLGHTGVRPRVYPSADGCTVEGSAGYSLLKLRAWSFVEGFRGRAGFGMGGARCYLSVLVDIAVVERGLDYVTALAEALEHAYGVYRSRGYGGVAEDYRRAYERWLGLDRSGLSTSKHLPAPPAPELGRDSVDEEPTVISLFTGAYGLDLGFELAGFRVAVALDISEDSYANLKANRPSVPFLLGDIRGFSTQDILREAGLRPGEVDVITGGPPCMPFSPAGKRRSLGDPRAAPLVEFVRVVREARPKVFVMEEVPGMLSTPDHAWEVVLEWLEGTGYRVAWRILNAADYGAPQVRERVIVVGVRPDLKRDPAFPRPTHSRDPGNLLGGLRPWLSLAEALVGVRDHIGLIPLPPKFAKFVKYVPPGGNWRQLPDDLRQEAMDGAYNSGGGMMGFYRRLTWFEPSPTLVTSPAMKATMMVHPWEDRPLSVGEYLRLQGFPDGWRVAVPARKAYRLFGEAVPVPMARAIARAVRDGILCRQQGVYTAASPAHGGGPG